MDYPSKKIYDEIQNCNHQIDKIIVYVDSKKKFITLTIFFQSENELLSLLESLSKINLELNSDMYNSSIIITLIIDKNESYLDFISKKLFFPPNISSIEYCINLTKRDEKSHIKINNLPSKLLELKITSEIIFDLSVLPNNIKILNLSGSKFAFNLNYLPNSIEILYLPFPYDSRNLIFTIFNKKKLFELEDLMNLPSSIKEIYIDNNKYNSIEYLIQNFSELKN